MRLLYETAYRFAAGKVEQVRMNVETERKLSAERNDLFTTKHYQVDLSRCNKSVVANLWE